jgi:hypothetical protein
MTVHPSTMILQAVLSDQLHHPASADDQFEAVGNQHAPTSRISISMPRLDSSGQTQQDRCFVSPASPHFVWQAYLWWRGRAPRSRTRIGQGSLIASLLWEDAASHAGASRRLWFDWSPTAAYQILTWQTGGLLDPPRTVRVKHAVAHPHVERALDSSSVLREESRTLQCRLGSGITDQHYLAVTSESAGAECEVCRVAAWCQDDLERCIWRAGNSNE